MMQPLLCVEEECKGHKVVVSPAAQAHFLNYKCVCSIFRPTNVSAGSLFLVRVAKRDPIEPNVSLFTERTLTSLKTNTHTVSLHKLSILSLSDLIILIGSGIPSATRSTAMVRHRCFTVGGEYPYYNTIAVLQYTTVPLCVSSASDERKGSVVSKNPATVNVTLSPPPPPLHCYTHTSNQRTKYRETVIGNCMCMCTILSSWLRSDFFTSLPTAISIP